ncbi:hypothetical protein [uncultured Massilia sp.]|uniref:hypothetical protein n=1 Tax=uncultured Massilia sp. TaxID=169973 RepID=UPI0025DD1F89|nr:hypothetical protein [uncultured Massilia sp.]
MSARAHAATGGATRADGAPSACRAIRYAKFFMSGGIPDLAAAASRRVTSPAGVVIPREAVR